MPSFVLQPCIELYRIYRINYTAANCIIQLLCTYIFPFCTISPPPSPPSLPFRAYEEGVKAHCDAFMRELGDVPVIACVAIEKKGINRVLETRTYRQYFGTYSD